MQQGKLKALSVLTAIIVGTSSCAYVEPRVSKPANNESIGIDQYDDDAINQYISGLKGVVQFLSATQTAESTTIMQGQMLLGLALGQMKTSKIEVDSWPYGARNKVWQIKGGRIQSYNNLVNEESARILADDAYDEKLKNLVRSIKLMTKENLLVRY
jgi:hypothetical protein